MERVAIIGLGSIAQRHLNNIRILLPHVKVMIMSASGRQLSQPSLGADFTCNTIDELLYFRPNMVIIASPATYHSKHIATLISHKVPVMIEKPIAADIGQAKAVCAAVSKAEVPIAVGYILRYMGSAAVMKKVISNDIVGKIYHVSVNVGQYLPDWRPNKPYQESVSASKKLGGGVLLELSHEFDYLRWLFGPLTLSYARLAHSRELGLEVEDIADLVLTFGQGSVCSLHMDFLQKVVQRYCHVVGELGRLEWDIVTNSVTLYTPNAGKAVLYSEPDFDRNQMYLSLMQSFLEAINNKNPIALHVEDACETVALIDEIKKTAHWGNNI